MLCEELLCEIANDVLEYTGNGHDRKNADPLERAEIRRRYQPYIEQFPQYQKLAEEILMGEDSMVTFHTHAICKIKKRLLLWR